MSTTIKILIRSIQGKSFVAELDPEQTILDVKTMIEEKWKYLIAGQKLIHSAKILQDQTHIKDIDFKGKQFFVVAYKKPIQTQPKLVEKKVEKPKENNQSMNIENKTEENKTEEKKNEGMNIEKKTEENQKEQNKTEEKKESYSSGASSMVNKENYEETINMIAGMGFEIPQIKLALRAAFGNPNRAIEYLVNGIPEQFTQQNLGSQQTQNQTENQNQNETENKTENKTENQNENETENQTQTQTNTNTNNSSFNIFGGGQQNQNQNQNTTQNETTTDSPLETLRNHPQFNQLKQMIIQNPNLIQPIIQQLTRESPELGQYIITHPQEFLGLLSGGTGGSGGGSGGSGGLGGMGGMGGGGSGGRGRGRGIQVTQEEMEQIQRLEGLGFERSQVVQAWLACEKNETQAAQLLFTFRDEEEQNQQGGGQQGGGEQN
ncbi:hypothetical protein M0813_26259 [Anaeramoeba flamelloides]|uniref:UV excision repair protein RAD23 n=1 Tax=Anaeramoeba flamelloides TaxID=1746091 RepID=A0ABQ8Y126_9EUKA|nr:hypothetical protein M0813_26259 [Anaeramoeba flamelloides]